MIRLLLYSQDISLDVMLAPTLGSEFSLFLERRSDKVREIISKGQCDVLILDLDCSAYSIRHQLEFLDEIRDFGVPVVVMTDDDSRESAMEMVQRGVYNYIRKPPALPELKIVVRRAHEYTVLKRELENMRLRLPPPGCDRLIGTSARSQGLIRRVANLEASVLITGESGTGKELTAHAIHNLSNRKGRPFVAVSCGAIPETLVETELFGAERGAFTGAATGRKGYLKKAGNGTLFFDEIGEFTPHTQVKLLRVLQERIQPSRQQPDDPPARPAVVRHTSEPAGDGRRGNLSPGPLLPGQCYGNQISGVARPRRHPDSGWMRTNSL